MQELRKFLFQNFRFSRISRCIKNMSYLTHIYHTDFKLISPDYISLIIFIFSSLSYITSFPPFFFLSLYIFFRISSHAACAHAPQNKNSTTALSSSASTLPTRNCNSSSTTTCSCSSKRSTRKRASIGCSLISAWTC